MITMDKETENYVRNLSLNQLVRWICLINGVNVVLSAMDRMDIDHYQIFETKSGMNLLERSLLKYAKERFETVKQDLLIDPECYTSTLIDSMDVIDDQFDLV